jgi:hypothetical protein
MKIKNKVNVTLEDGKLFSFVSNDPINVIKRKYSPGSLFINGKVFGVNIIDSMTVHSLNSNVKIENNN